MNRSPQGACAAAWLLTTLIGAGCGSPSDVGSGTEAATGGATSGSVGSSSGEATDASAETSTTSDSVDTTGETGVACRDFGPLDCPDEACITIATYTDSPDACSAEGAQLCVDRGEPVPADSRTTYHAMIDGTQHYFVTGVVCRPQPAFRPGDWAECTSAEGQPDACGCLCGADGCPWDADLQALQSCEAPQPCGDVEPHQRGGSYYTEYDECVLTALRDRTPSLLRSEYSGGLTGDTSVVLLDGRGQAQFLNHSPSDLSCFEGALFGKWDPLALCTLKPPSFFDDCLADPSQVSQCLFGRQWFESCEETTPSCP